MYDVIPDSDEQRHAQAAENAVARQQLSAVRQIPPSAVLAYRTPLEQHPLSADGKATTVLTLVGLMFTILGRFAPPVHAMLKGDDWMRPAAFVLLISFALLAFAAVVQSFRTISPRFPKVAPSLAFFGDIARLSREEYVAKVEALDAQQALDQMLLYNHTSAVIIVQKLRQLRYVFRLFQAALAVWVLLLGLIGWKLWVQG